MTRRRASELRPGTRHWKLAIRICGRLLADAGETQQRKARNIAIVLGWSDQVRSWRGSDGKSRGSYAAQAVNSVMRALEELNLARRRDGVIVADDLADVAAWVADELDLDTPVSLGADDAGGADMPSPHLEGIPA